jgi:hypothetical protein
MSSVAEGSEQRGSGRCRQEGCVFLYIWYVAAKLFFMTSREIGEREGVERIRRQHKNDA